MDNVAKKERIYWIDWAKVLAIMLVVWGHISSYLHNPIYLFHMPLFFMISGYLYHEKEKRIEFLSILYSLIIPYLLYNVIYLLPLPLGGGYQKGYITQILLGNQEQLTYLMRPLWFIVSLCMMRLICLTRIDMRILGITCFVLSIGLGEINYFLENDYYQLRTSILCFPFFALGQWVRTISFPNTDKIKVILTIIVVVLFLAIILLAREYDFNAFRCRTGNSVLLFYTIATSLSLLFLSFCYLCLNKGSHYIRIISNGTLFILCTHLIIFWKIPKLPIPDITQDIICLLTIFIVSYWLIILASKYCPIMIGKKK